MFRTHTCGELRKSHEGQTVTLAGWVHRRRDHGGLIFIDLRDRYGLTQIFSDPKEHADAHAIMNDVRSEFVVQITGVVRARPANSVNGDLETGGIEILVTKVSVLNASKTPPFEIDVDKDINEEVRLKYRYLDIRRERMKTNLVMRHQVIKFIRDFMDTKQFIEVETPMLVKGTPEGSREYVVPSRLYPGKFYVLPQSPQQMKQLLMVAGMDRYFQIARCFRDEDQRGDRQPEFTQLDIEMSFVEVEDIMNLNEELLLLLFKTFLPHKKLMFQKLPRLTWQECMEKYGVDKPDLRFGMEIQIVSEVVKGSGFKVFEDALKSGVVHALRVPGGAKFSRKEIDDLTEVAKIHEAKGLAYITIEEDGSVKSPIAKFFSEEQMAKVVASVSAVKGDIVFFGADSFSVVCASLGAVRLACGDKLGLRDPDVLAPLWAYNFPLMEMSKEEGKLVPSHHPFTSPLDEDVHLMDTDPAKVRAKAYDLVLNGNEIGGGSIRIHSSEVQSKIFDLLKISREEAQVRFGHILTAFQYGAPPHGGIAWGLDRLIMIFRNEPNIREVIAFPKDSKAKDLMFGAPSTLPKKQIDEVHVEVKDVEE